MIAILVYVHKNKELAQRLINKLAHKEVDVYVHVDSKYNAKSFENAKIIKNRHSINWGDKSIVDSIICSLSEIKNSKYTRYILISGQDYPIANINKIVDFLNNNKSKEFIEYRKIGKNKDEWDVEYRYNFFHFIKNKYLNRISQKFYHNRKFIDNYIPYGGSLWWMLTGSSIEYILKTYKELNISRKLRMTVCMDEVMFQSILCNSLFKKNIVNNNYHYIDWSDHVKGNNKGNPNVLTINDYEKIINSNKFFARKFDDKVDEKILNMIDKHIKK